MFCLATSIVLVLTRRVRPLKQTLGRQVVSTLPVKHILLLQHLHEPRSPVSTARPMWLTSGRIRRAGAGPCTLVVYQRRSRRIG